MSNRPRSSAMNTEVSRINPISISKRRVQVAPSRYHQPSPSIPLPTDASDCSTNRQIQRTTAPEFQPRSEKASTTHDRSPAKFPSPPAEPHHFQIDLNGPVAHGLTLPEILWQSTLQIMFPNPTPRRLPNLPNPICATLWTLRNPLLFQKFRHPAHVNFLASAFQLSSGPLLLRAINLPQIINADVFHRNNRTRATRTTSHKSQKQCDSRK